MSNRDQTGGRERGNRSHERLPAFGAIAVSQRGPLRRGGRPAPKAPPQSSVSACRAHAKGLSWDLNLLSQPVTCSRSYLSLAMCHCRLRHLWLDS